MKRLALLALLVACGELRSATMAAPGPDASVSDSGEDPTLDASIDRTTPELDADATIEGGTKPRDPVCNGSCAVETLSDASFLGWVTVDDANVYFASFAGGVFQCPKAGCNGTRTTLTSAYSAKRIAVFGGKVIWPDGSKLVACAIGGCSAAPAPFIDEGGDQTVSDVQTDNGRLFWLSTAATTARIRMCSGSDCSATTTTAATRIVASNPAISGNRVAWVENVDIRSCTLGNCAATASFGSGIAPLAIGGQSLFWYLSGTILTCSIDDCSATKKVFTPNSADIIVSDAKDLYWRNLSAGTIYRCPLTGCPSPEIVSLEASGNVVPSLALDAEYIYWTTKDGLFRRRK